MGDVVEFSERYRKRPFPAPVREEPVTLIVFPPLRIDKTEAAFISASLHAADYPCDVEPPKA